MPRFVVEREVPGAANLTPSDLKMISQKSCGILEEMGPAIQWVESYVTPDKIYCIYIAPNEEMIRKHAAEGGFPANKISKIRTVFGPMTAEA